MHIPEHAMQYFLTAKNCSNLMLFLVKDFMDLLQIESKSLIPNFSTTTIIELIQESIDMLKFKADEKVIGLSIAECPQ